jgi:hypothetical protein
MSKLAWAVPRLQPRRSVWSMSKLEESEKYDW